MVFFRDPCYLEKGLGFVLGYIKDLQNSTKLIGEGTYRGKTYMTENQEQYI